jgi:excisionase family DNA binding protein
MNAIEELRKQPGYIGAREAGRLLGVSRYTILDWAKAEKSFTYRIGSATKLHRADLADWMEARRVL